MNIWFGLGISTIWGVMVALAVHALLPSDGPLPVSDSHATVTPVPAPAVTQPVVADIPPMRTRIAPARDSHTPTAVTSSRTAPEATVNVHYQAARTPAARPPRPGTLASRPPSGTADQLIPLIAEQASRRVALLERSVALDEEARVAAFNAYAYASASLAGVVATPDETVSDVQQTADEEIHDSLEAEEQVQYEEEWVERDLWWSEIIGDLHGELSDGSADDAASVVAAPSVIIDETPVVEETTDGHAGGNLFDMLSP